MSLQHFLLTKLNVMSAGRENIKFKGPRCIFTKQAKRVNLELITAMTIIYIFFSPNPNFKPPEKCFNVSWVGWVSTRGMIKLPDIDKIQILLHGSLESQANHEVWSETRLAPMGCAWIQRWICLLRAHHVHYGVNATCFGVMGAACSRKQGTRVGNGGVECR